LYGEDSDTCKKIVSQYPFSSDITKIDIAYDENEKSYKDIWKRVNETVIKNRKTLKKYTYTYTVALNDMYASYSDKNGRGKIDLDVLDIVEMFILCLHYPSISIENGNVDNIRINFHKIDYSKQGEYMKIMEKMALYYIEHHPRKK
jgi:hypothetical protein